MAGTPASFARRREKSRIREKGGHQSKGVDGRRVEEQVVKGEEAEGSGGCRRGGGWARRRVGRPSAAESCRRGESRQVQIRKA
jgi:hypothetical protein